MRRHAAVLIAALALLPLQAAQGAAAPADNHADWIGFYRYARGADLSGFTPEFPDDRSLDAEVVKRLQPWARLLLEQTNGAAEDTGAICQLNGIFRVPLTGGGFMWLPAGGKVLLVPWAIYSTGIRKVFVGRPHRPYAPPTWMGDSIGRWDGDVFVVDTIGFNERSWLTPSMMPHSEALHVVERYRMAVKGLMEVRTVVEDRQALTAPYTYSRYYKLAEREAPENVCNPDPGDQRMWATFRAQARKAGMRPVASKQP